MLEVEADIDRLGLGTIVVQSGFGIETAPDTPLTEIIAGTFGPDIGR